MMSSYGGIGRTASVVLRGLHGMPNRAEMGQRQSRWKAEQRLSPWAGKNGFVSHRPPLYNAQHCRTWLKSAMLWFHNTFSRLYWLVQKQVLWVLSVWFVLFFFKEKSKVRLGETWESLYSPLISSSCWFHPLSFVFLLLSLSFFL